VHYLSRLILGITLVLGCGLAAAQDRTYVNIPNIPGESTDAAHVGWIDAYGLSSDRANSITFSSGGVGGSASFTAEPTFILKATDLSSPQLQLALAGGTVITGDITIDVCREPAIGGQECYYTMVITDAAITEIRLSGSSCVDPLTSCVPAQTESVGIIGVKLQQTYRSFVGGSVSQTRCTYWDVETNVGATCQ